MTDITIVAAGRSAIARAYARTTDGAEALAGLDVEDWRRMADGGIIVDYRIIHAADGPVESWNIAGLRADYAEVPPKRSVRAIPRAAGR